MEDILQTLCDYFIRHSDDVRFIASRLVSSCVYNKPFYAKRKLFISYGMAQLQGNKYTQVTPRKSCASREYMQGYLPVKGFTRIKISTRFQLITMYVATAWLSINSCICITPYINSM